jgi:hypothetical protein
MSQESNRSDAIKISNSKTGKWLPCLLMYIAPPLNSLVYRAILKSISVKGERQHIDKNDLEHVADAIHKLSVDSCLYL